MSYCDEDFADMLFAWPAVEGRILHLYELDPTHVIAQPTSIRTSKAGSQAMQASRSPQPFCVLTDIATAPVLLELDPTHMHAC
jgi:hypothetical protein